MNGSRILLVEDVELCRRLRAAVPDGVIVVLTARTGEFDVVIALDAGADDYLTKPFRLTELLARLRAHLRRLPAAAERTLIEAGKPAITFATGDFAAMPPSADGPAVG